MILFDHMIRYKAPSAKHDGDFTETNLRIMLGRKTPQGNYDFTSKIEVTSGTTYPVLPVNNLTGNIYNNKPCMFFLRSYDYRHGRY